MNKRLETIYNVYMFIRGFIKENGYSPSYNVMCKKLGYSRGTIYGAVHYLVTERHLKRPKYGALVLTDKPFNEEPFRM